MASGLALAPCARANIQKKKAIVPRDVEPGMRSGSSQRQAAALALHGRPRTLRNPDMGAGKHARRKKASFHGWRLAVRNACSAPFRGN